MIDLYNGQLTDLLQNDLKDNPDVRAISFAIQKEKQRLLRLEAKTRTLSMIDELDEEVLDVLGVELRTPYYSGDLTIAQKRAIIKSTLGWFFRAGTPAAVEEMVTAIFGQGEVVEWFNFTEGPFTPGTFDIITDTRMTEDIVARLLQIIGQVKNARSHLRRVLVERHGYQNVYIGTGAVTAPETNVLNNTDTETGYQDGKIAIGAGATSASRAAILNSAPARERIASGAVRIGAALAVESETNVLNSPPPGTASIRQRQKIFTAAVASSQITIP